MSRLIQKVKVVFMLRKALYTVCPVPDRPVQRWDGRREGDMEGGIEMEDRREECIQTGSEGRFEAMWEGSERLAEGERERGQMDGRTE